MEKPSCVTQGVIAIVATLVISSLLALYQSLVGQMSKGEFIFNILMYSLLCIIPYKINNKSNSARYVYLVVTLASFFIMLSGIDYEKYKLEYIVSIFLAPVEIYIMYCLFKKEASDWFSSK